MKAPGNIHAYWVLGCCFLFSMVSMGAGMSSFSVFIKILQHDFGWNRTEIMGAYTLLLVATAMASPLVGRLIDCHSAPKVILVGVLVAATGLVVLGHTDSLGQFYFGYFLIGAGFTATGHLTSSFIVSYWFQTRRGWAIGIMSMGVGVATLVFVPLTGVFLIPKFGWRFAYLIHSLMALVIILPLSQWGLTSSPRDSGHGPDGGNVPDKKLSNSVLEGYIAIGIPLNSAVTSSAFWLLGFSLLLNNVHLGVVVSLYPYFLDLGFSPGLASLAMGLCGLGATAGMFAFGWLCDRILPTHAAAIGLSMLCLGILAINKINLETPLLWVVCGPLMIGMGMGSWLPTLSMLVSSIFGLGAYGSIFGTMCIFQNIGAGTGPLLAGYIFDQTHSYYWAFASIAVIVAMAIPLILLTRNAQRSLFSQAPTE